MYTVSACVNDISVVHVPLDPENSFALDTAGILSKLSSPEGANIKLIYVCSPGNPTATLVPKSAIEPLLTHPTWNGIVVVDEAYVDFAATGPSASLAEWVTEWPNLVVMQTLSKAFGLAGIRLGAAFASEEVAALLNNLKAPYNISSVTSQLASQALQQEHLEVMRGNLAKIVAQRERLMEQLPQIPGMGRFRGGFESNFLLIEVLDRPNGKPCNETALKVYERLAENKGVVVRFRGKEYGCQGCIRITVGTEKEVDRFLEQLKVVLEEVYKGGEANGVTEEQERDANDVVA
jgi:histidinol-phosphate aminotransferase